LERSWKASATSTGASAEKTSAREIKGCLLVGPRIVFPKEKKRRKRMLRGV